MVSSHDRSWSAKEKQKLELNRALPKVIHDFESEYEARVKADQKTLKANAAHLTIATLMRENVVLSRDTNALMEAQPSLQMPTLNELDQENLVIALGAEALAKIWCHIPQPPSQQGHKDVESDSLLVRFLRIAKISVSLQDWHKYFCSERN